MPTSNESQSRVKRFPIRTLTKCVVRKLFATQKFFLFIYGLFNVNRLVNDGQFSRGPYTPVVSLTFQKLKHLCRFEKGG